MKARSFPAVDLAFGAMKARSFPALDLAFGTMKARSYLKLPEPSKMNVPVTLPEATRMGIETKRKR